MSRSQRLSRKIIVKSRIKSRSKSEEEEERSPHFYYRHQFSSAPPGYYKWEPCSHWYRLACQSRLCILGVQMQTAPTAPKKILPEARAWLFLWPKVTHAGAPSLYLVGPTEDFAYRRRNFPYNPGQGSQFLTSGAVSTQHPVGSSYPFYCNRIHSIRFW